MRNSNERGEAGGWRSSVLWGTGTRGGDSRSHAQSVKIRGALAAVLAVCAFMAVVAGTATPANADPGQGRPGQSQGFPANGHRPAWVSPGLLAKARTAPGSLVDVIIQSDAGSTGADAAVRASGWKMPREFQLGLISGIELKVPAAFMPFLLKIPGITVTPNAKVLASGDETLTSGVPGVDSSQVWPFSSGNAALWGDDTTTFASSTPAIAVVDSGVSSDELGSRLIASVDLSTIDGNTSTDDQDGHGTFVANIAAGSSPTLTGADPAAPIVSVKVMDAQGEGMTSDVIAACQWILDHKDQYNIRVANFSLHSGYGTNSYNDPLDQAVEKLWFNGVTVVAAAGNYGTGDVPSNVLFSPGNDPFVITVGAADITGTSTSTDDGMAPWSAWGHTEDGFAKPEISAPGRYMVTEMPDGASLTSELPNNLLTTSPTTMQISGTSFSAPVVSGTAAEILARHPSYTPDQIKGELMKSARTVPGAVPGQAGVGEITAPWAANDTDPPNPNAGLDQFVAPDSTGTPVFDSDSWKTAVQTNASWNDASWNDASWNDASWNDASWNDASWNDASWNDASWNDASWNDASWNDASWNDASWNDASWNDFSAQDAAQEDAALTN